MSKYQASKAKVIISRQWHNPEIDTVISTDGISLSMKIEDFKKALAIELNTSDDKVSEAVDQVILGIKKESVQVV